MWMRRLLVLAVLLGVGAYLCWPEPARALRPIDAWPLVAIDDQGNPTVTTVELKDRDVVVYTDAIGSALNPDPATLRGLLQALGPSSSTTIVLRKKGAGSSYDTSGGPITMGKPPGDSLGVITIRGETNEPSDTVISGNLAVNNVFDIYNCFDITFAHLTIQNSKQALVYIHGKDFPTISRIRFYRCNLLYAQTKGRIYADGDPWGTGNVTQNCTVEFCNIGSTTAFSPGTPDHDDAHGITVEGGVGWVIRHNLFFWIVPANKNPGVGGYSSDSSETGGRRNFAIMMMKGSKDSEIYGNTFSYCEAPVTIGEKDYGGVGGRHAHVRGVVRNNTFYCYKRKISYPAPGWPGWLESYAFVVAQDANENLKIVHNSGVYYDGTSNPWLHLYYAGTSGFVAINNIVNSSITKEGCVGTEVPNLNSPVAAGYGAPGSNGYYYDHDYNTSVGLPSNHAVLAPTAPPNDGYGPGYGPPSAWFVWLHNHWQYNPAFNLWGTYGQSLGIQQSLVADFHLAPTPSNSVAADVIDEVAVLEYAADDWDTGTRAKFKAAVEALGGDSVGVADYGADEWNVPRPWFNYGGGGGDGGPKPKMGVRTGNRARVQGRGTQSLDQVRVLLLQRRKSRSAGSVSSNARQSHDEDEAAVNWREAMKNAKDTRRQQRSTSANSRNNLDQKFRSGSAR